MSDGSAPPTPPPQLGLLAVKYNLITREQLADILSSLSMNAGNGKPASLESILLERGWVTASQIETLKSAELLGKVSQMSRQFGTLAVQKSLISEEDLKNAFEKQALLFKKAKTVRHVKDILLEEGRIGKADHDALMAELEGGPSKKNGGEKDTLSASDIEKYYELIVPADRMSALLKAKSAEAPKLSPAAVYRLLESGGVSHGLLEEDELAARLSSPMAPDTPVVIAEGIPPRQGQAAVLKHHFAKDQKIGTIGTHGEIDFKNRGEVPFVRQGDLLVEKTPAVPGTAGYDLFGGELKPAPPADAKLLFGAGVELSEDKLKLYAKTDGQPKLSLGGRLAVVSDLVINGDVDLKSGHVEFEGNVKITGTIQSGFQVKGANIDAKEILGAQLVASGNVTATGGIIGTVIKAQGDIKAKYIKHATLSTFGDVIVQKEITDSNINTSGACRVERGKILSSEISAKQGIDASDIGTDLSNPCRLTVGVDDHIEAETEGLQNAISRREEHLSNLNNQISTLDAKQQDIHKEIADLAQVQDRALVKQRAAKQQLDEHGEGEAEKRTELEGEISALGLEAQRAEDTLGNLFDRQDELTHQTEKLQQECEQVKDDICELKNELEAIRHWAKSQKKPAAIKVGGAIVQGTFISGPHTRTLIKETARHVTIREVKNTDPDSAVDWEIKLQSD